MEGLMLKLKLQYFGHLMRRADSLERTLMLGGIGGRRRRGCPTLCDPMDCIMPGFPVIHYLLKFAQNHVHCVNDAIQSSHPLHRPLFLPSIFPSIRVFSNESVLRIRGPKYWSFSFSVSPSNEYSELICRKTYWFDLAVQGTLRSLSQHHSLKASILWCSAFFTVQLSQPFMTTGKSIA